MAYVGVKPAGISSASQVETNLLDVDNITIDGNTISSTDTNGDIMLDPDGTGKVSISGALHIDSGSDNANTLLLSDGAADNNIVDGFVTCRHHSSSEEPVHMIQGRATSSENIVLIGGTHNNTTYNTATSIKFFTAANSTTTTPSERMRIDSNGRTGIGTTSPATYSAGGSNLVVANSNSGANAVGMSLVNPNNTVGTSVSLEFVPNSNIALASISSPRTAANGATDLAFNTYTGSSMTEKVRISSDGNVLVGKTTTTIGDDGVRLTATAGNANNFTMSLGTPMQINRKGDDGGLINFLQDTSLEGGISVSGSTVSYNGGHLSRWSQATDGNRIDGLVKGTVMTNLDQMAVWHHEAQPATYYEEGDELPEGVSVGDEKTPAVAAYDEDNEQLNCMAVSSVEGDANVAGVFVNWDDDDEDFTTDMNIAMTGDMVIRIAQGTTVARGDLLMSAGDGTAKPQGDDIVRSKTIAKVTSTTVSHTYDDGSYLVPCVLMAC